MVKSEQLYSPQNYLCSVTGLCYIINGDDDVSFIEETLILNNMEEMHHYPLNDINVIVKDNLDVVLVDCMVYDEDIEEYVHRLEWFEVPREWSEEEDDYE